jgi:molecular chaperone HscA
LSEDTITGMLQSSFSAAESDKQARALREATVDAERLIEAIQVALTQDGAQLLSAEEQKTIQLQIQALQTLNQGQDSHAIHQATEALNHATEAFAARRMDASVKQALAGQDVNTLEL